MYGVISNVHARGIRKSQCLAASEALLSRLEARPRKGSPKRRRPWLKYWQAELRRVSGELNVATIIENGRRPYVGVLYLEPRVQSAMPQGFQLLYLEARFGQPKFEAMSLPIHVCAHAVEQMVARANYQSLTEWRNELRPALLATLQLIGNRSLVMRLLEVGRGDRIHLATTKGCVRAVWSEEKVSFVTWLHWLDLSEANRIEASMQEAYIAQHSVRNEKRGQRDETSLFTSSDLLDGRVLCPC